MIIRCNLVLEGIESEVAVGVFISLFNLINGACGSISELVLAAPVHASPSAAALPTVATEAAILSASSFRRSILHNALIIRRTEL